jgi:hypothetical protein
MKLKSVKSFTVSDLMSIILNISILIDYYDVRTRFPRPQGAWFTLVRGLLKLYRFLAIS